MRTYSEIKQAVIEAVSDVLCIDVEEVTPEKTFKKDLGADEVDYFEIILEIEDSLGDFFDDFDDFDDSVLEEIPDTVKDLIDNIAKLLNVKIEK